MVSLYRRTGKMFLGFRVWELVVVFAMADQRVALYGMASEHLFWWAIYTIRSLAYARKQLINSCLPLVFCFFKTVTHNSSSVCAISLRFGPAFFCLHSTPKISITELDGSTKPVVRSFNICTGNSAQVCAQFSMGTWPVTEGTKVSSHGL